FSPAMAHAQAGMEAGAATSHAAMWAKHQKESGTSTSATTTKTTTKTSGATGGKVSGRAAGTTLPERKTRPSSRAPGSLSGQVLERGNAKPVPGVLVRLESTEPQYVVETKLARTDSSGAWLITDVEPGRWSLNVDNERLPETYASSESPRTLIVAKNDVQHVA